MKVSTGDEIREFMIPGYLPYTIPPGGVVHSKNNTRLDIDHGLAEECDLDGLCAEADAGAVFNAVFDINRRACYFTRLDIPRPAPPSLDDLEDDLLDVGEAWGGEDAALVGARTRTVR